MSTFDEDPAPEIAVVRETSPSSSRILIQMRVALHVTFALLLGLGMYRTIADSALPAGQRTAVIAVSIVLAIVYLAGTVLEKRYAQGRMRRAQRRFAELREINTQRATRLWFALTFALWGILVVLSENFMWLAFPMFFLCLHVLGPRWGLLGVAATVILANTHTILGDTTFAIPAALLGTLIGAALAIVVFQVYRALLAEAEAQRLALEHLRAARSDLAAAERTAVRLAERERIAAEVHDTIAQELASIVLMARASPGGSETLRTIEQSAQLALVNTRRLVRELGAPSQETSARIQETVDQVRAQATIAQPTLRIDLVIEGDPVALPDSWNDVLQNAARASLSNVILHAKASIAVVTLSFFAPGVRLDIVDNGAGMSEADAERSRGRGIDLLRRRVLALGGRVALESHSGAEGSGTSVSVELGMNDGNA